MSKPIRIDCDEDIYIPCRPGLTPEVIVRHVCGENGYCGYRESNFMPASTDHEWISGSRLDHPSVNIFV